MSFSGLLNSLWNSKSGGNKSNVSNNPPPMRGTQGLQGSPGLRGTQNTQDIYSQTNINTSVPISQGKEYMLYKQTKVNSVNNEINNFNVNGHQNSNYNSNYNSNSNSNSNSNYGNIREGFDGMIGPSQVNKKNQTDSSNRQTMEDEFNRSISSYATSQRNLMDKSQQFLQGKRTYGKNIHALQAANTDDIIPNWVGCYKSGNDGLIEQTDLGNNTNITDCKVRASDLGYSTFALRQKGPSAGNTCFVGDNIDTAQSGGLATKPVLSYAFSKSEGANIGGLMMNGQIGVYEDDITNNLKTDLTALANCDISIGGQINANTSIATYGYNCNGTAKSPFTAPPPQPAAVIPTPAGYTKYPNKGSGGNDIIKMADGTSLADLAAACDKNANCAGFENSGFIKSAIVPQSQWISMIYNGQVMDLYVKNPKPPKPPTPPTPPVNCSKYGENDTNLPDECYNEIWKSVCPAPMPDTSWWRTQTKQAVQLNMYEVSTMPDPRLRAMCYTMPPVAKTGSTINTGSLWSKPWVRIDNGTWANSLSQLNDGTIVCTNGDGNTFLTQVNNISGWVQQTLSIPVKSVIQLQDSRFLGVGKNDNSLYIKDNINDRWDGWNPSSDTNTQVVTPKAKSSCHTDANSLVRGQTVYTGCGYTYASESARNAECGSGGTSKWIGDGYTNDCLNRAQTVYSGCGYTYATESSRNAQCGPGGTSMWIGDGYTTTTPDPPTSSGKTKKVMVRYVKININKNNECLQIAQLAVYSNGVNIAPGKTASAPNIYSSQSVPAKAIDGTLSTRDYPNIYHSACRSGDYWLLDLGTEYDIEKIVYYNRRDCCSTRANGMVLQIFDNNMTQTKFTQGNFTLNSDMVQTITLYNTQIPDPNTCCVISIVQLNNGSLIGVGTDNYLWKRNKLSDNWKQIKCPSSCCVTSISKLSDGITIVAIGTNGYVYTRQENQVWTLVDQSMKMSAVTQLKDGRVIGLDQNGNYFSK